MNRLKRILLVLITLPVFLFIPVSCRSSHALVDEENYEEYEDQDHSRYYEEEDDYYYEYLGY